jgi:hypothetical protein
MLLQPPEGCSRSLVFHSTKTETAPFLKFQMPSDFRMAHDVRVLLSQLDSSLLFVHQPVFSAVNRQLQGRIQKGPECAAALPVLPRLPRRSTAEEDGGLCHGERGEFQIHVARGPTPRTPRKQSDNRRRTEERQLQHLVSCGLLVLSAISRLYCPGSGSMAA